MTEFIDTVWKPNFETNQQLRLIVGGRNPSETLEKKLYSISNCEFYKNFSSLEDVVPIGSLIIAPIQKGAGMKVKVAESLSMGLPIVASDEALVGYEEALRVTEGVGLMRANTPEEYISAIKQYIRYTDEQLIEIENRNKNTYLMYYSYTRSRESIRRQLTELVRE